METQYFTGKYNTQTTIAFVLLDYATTGSDTFYNDAAPANTEIYIFGNGAYVAQATNSATEVPETTGAGVVSIYTLVLTAGEMSYDYLDIIVTNGGTNYRDAHLKVIINADLGQLDIDSSQNTNTSALIATGQGTGHGISAVGGATGQDINGILGEHTLISGTNNVTGTDGTHFDMQDFPSVSSSNDYYNGAIALVVSGTGAGQARVVTDYVGSTNVATVNKAWVTNPNGTSVIVLTPGPDPWKISPGAELTTTPTASSNYADMLQFLFQRFAYKRTMTSTLFQMFNAAGDTAKFEATLADAAGTQTHGAVADV